MSLLQFEIGTPYYAHPAMHEHPKMIVVPIGREGNQLQIATIKSLHVANMKVFDGREWAGMNLDLGFYSMSATTPATADEAAVIFEILGQKHIQGN